MASRRRRLRAMLPAVVREVSQAMFVAADEVAGEAAHSITVGSASGTETEKHRHVVSRPGDPPNNFTGHLKDNIEISQPAPLHAQVTSHASYSAALEFGTSKMAARPFMRPALIAKEAKVQKIITTAARRAARRFMGTR